MLQRQKSGTRRAGRIFADGDEIHLEARAWTQCDPLLPTTARVRIGLGTLKARKSDGNRHRDGFVEGGSEPPPGSTTTARIPAGLIQDRFLNLRLQL